MNNHSKISVRTLTAMALLIAMSIVFSWVLSISTGFVRFNLGSLPVLLAGILFGPWAGAKREPEKHPLLSRRGRHESRAARASRCAKLAFFSFLRLAASQLVLRPLQGVKFSRKVKSSAEP